MTLQILKLHRRFTMSIENIDSENTQHDNFELATSLLEEKATLDWNGRVINQALVGEELKMAANFIFSKKEKPLNPFLGKITIDPSYCIHSADFKPELRLCGENIDHEVSARGSIDTEGNRSVEIEYEASSKDGDISGSVSGSVSQDSDGNVGGKVEVETSWSF